jgi:hypothetical protein
MSNLQTPDELARWMDRRIVVLATIFVALLVLCLCSGCGGQPETVQPAPDFDVDGVGVKVIGSDLRWEHAADLPHRVERVIRTAAQYAGGSFDQLQGWVIVFQAEAVDCGSQAAAWGCTNHDARTIMVSVSTWHPGCVESTVLAHEVVHDILGDGAHSLGLWRCLPP